MNKVNKFQRDEVIKIIYKAAQKNKKIFFLSADFGAAALDKLREQFPKNFIHCGISEQAMLDIAAGLALEKNKVFVYAMAPFLSLRAIEQAKCGPGLMNLPICMICCLDFLGRCLRFACADIVDHLRNVRNAVEFHVHEKSASN